MTSMLDRVLGKKLNPVTAIWWMPTNGAAQNISCAISTGYSLADDSPEEYAIPFIAGEVTVGEGVDVFPLADGGTLIRRLGKPVNSSKSGVKFNLTDEQLISTSEKYEGKLTFFRDSSDTTPFETVFNLFKEPEVTAPAKPDYARMERKELMDRIDLLENALASTETNVRRYMDDAKKAAAALAEERRKKTPLLRFEQQAQLKTLEASREFDSKRIAELQNDLANQRTKYKIKLKECGAVIGTLKGMIKDLTK